jgi:uncharacterized membrane protein YdjX (TVP38/TMEM64 family)
MSEYLLVVAVVFGVNLLPAFGPPTWAVLVALRFTTNVPVVPLVLLGALAAASGRYVLAAGSHRFRARLSKPRRESLDALERALGSHRGAAFGGLGLFALSPVPSAQLFVAAGLTGVRLLPVTLAFFGGRLVSYALYVGAASAANQKLGKALTNLVSSPVGIALEVAMLALLVTLMRVDWTRVLRGAPAGPTLPGSSSVNSSEEANGRRRRLA